MVFFKLFSTFSRRLGFVTWTLVYLLYFVDLGLCILDSDEPAFLSTLATFNGLSIMAASRKCCVPSCGLDNEILHNFPNPDKEPDRFRTWIYNIGGDILALDNMYIHKCRRVCHLHFENQYHTRSKFLSPNAVPTLRLSGLFLKRPPLMDVTNKTTPESKNRKANLACSATPSTSGLQQQRHVIDATLEQQAPELKNHESVIDTVPRQHMTELKSTTKRLPKSDEKALFKEVKKLQKKNDSFKQRLKKAMKLSTNAAFQKALNKFKTLAAVFTIMQFREIHKPKMARRFNKEEKVMALTLYKLGPRAYRWLSKIFVLPSPVTLSRLISKAALKPGLNEKIFQQLKKKALKMKTHEKLCTLIFDEMALTPHFDYNRKKDHITGFVNYKGQATKEIADHMLVFMIRGIAKNYKQPIYYSFCNGSTPKQILASQIKEIIKELHSIGFFVLATVCDQGATNVAAINSLIEENRIAHLRKNKTLKDAVFEVDQQTIVPLYDVPHLLKGLRNNLLTKNLKFTMDGEEKMAMWKHIELLYKNNPTYKGLKIIKNLSESHCNKDRIPKMKVKFASQLFSQTVGKTMGYLAENRLLPEETKDTADLIIFVDNLFDSLNGSYTNSKVRSGKDLLRNVTPNSIHKKVWSESKQVLKSMKFISESGNAGTIPTIKNWIHTLDNMELLTKTLFDNYEFKSIWCRHLNQDPLENFFGSIRSHGARNNKPTCAAFEAAFASLLINNLSSSYSPGSNCEEDFCAVFDSFDEIFFSSETNVSNESAIEIDIDDVMAEDFIEDFNEKQKNPVIKAQLEYVTGYLLRKCKKITQGCKQCLKDLYEKDLDKNKYLNRREYIQNKQYLTYPNANLKECFSAIQDIYYHIIRKKSHISNIKTYIKTILYVSVNTNFSQCANHKEALIEFIFDFLCRFFSYTWCKSTNKILNGNSKIRDIHSRDSVQEQALIYYTKRRKGNK